MDDVTKTTANAAASGPHTGRRLIERWLPTAALGIESLRERTPMTPFPAPNRLHVWWARRPLVASRAAVLGSLLPENADREKFLRAIGIHGDPVAAKKRIAIADRKGERLGADAYGYPRAFGWSPDNDDRHWMQQAGVSASVQLLDPTAGGGSIPFEAVRLGVGVLANDLNPVAALIEKATIEYPLKYGPSVLNEFKRIGADFTASTRARLASAYPDEPEPDTRPDAYLWARTICCPYCDGIIPLSPHWRLAPDGTGVRLHPHLGGGPHHEGRRCIFEIVYSTKHHSTGTVAMGDATCPYSDCARIVDAEELRSQARANKMGEQLFAVVFKRRIETRTKSGKRGKDKWERGYRAPRPEDDNSKIIKNILAERKFEWEVLGLLPTEEVESAHPKYDPRRWGMYTWRSFFSARQLLGHCTAVEVFRELYANQQTQSHPSEITKAAFIYLAIAIDKMLDWNSALCAWNPPRELMAHTFQRHDLAFIWSYAEMAPTVPGLGYDWTIEQTGKCIKELTELAVPEAGARELPLLSGTPGFPVAPLTITCKPGDTLDHISSCSIDAVVMDPPYYDNVMYAELSDFFYVWLKRTAGHVVPELFTRRLSDKENEAVASPSKFSGRPNALAHAGRDYQERMARIFEECRRVLKPDGILTLMFTHKATGAWDALTKGLMEAGFIITASWPINTEMAGSLHIHNKSAANSTIFLICRPRRTRTQTTQAGYWEDVEPLVARAVRSRVLEFQQAGVKGVDLYLASFGPALEEFSRHWPLKRGTPRPVPEARRRSKHAEVSEEGFNPYAVTPEDALEAARREVKRWRLEQLTHMKAHEELDPLTSFFVLAWDAFRAPVFPFDEALRLARAIGVDLDTQVVNVLCEKKGSDLVIWDSGRRAAKGALGSPDGRRTMIDAIHNAAHIGRTRTLAAARDLLVKVQVDREPSFFAALEAVLEVLPVSKAFSGIELDGDLAQAGSDFEALENLRKLAFATQVGEPRQLELWQSEAVV